MVLSSEVHDDVEKCCCCWLLKLESIDLDARY